MTFARAVPDPYPGRRPVQVVAHRGASEDVPEHTLAAYRKAIEDGADALECDVRLTADGELVCVHDWRVNRTSNGRGAVSSLELADLAALDFGSWKGQAADPEAPERDEGEGGGAGADAGAGTGGGRGGSAGGPGGGGARGRVGGAGTRRSAVRGAGTRRSAARGGGTRRSAAHESAALGAVDRRGASRVGGSGGADGGRPPAAGGSSGGADPGERSRVLTLHRLLELVVETDRHVELAIETKHPTRWAGQVEERLLHLLRRFDLDRPAPGEPSQVRVMSFSSRSLRRVRLAAPALPTVFLMQYVLPRYRDGRLPAGVGIAGPGMRVLRAHPEYVERVHRAGNQVHVWTVDRPEDVELCVRLGVDAIITNRPGWVLRQLGR